MKVKKPLIIILIIIAAAVLFIVKKKKELAKAPVFGRNPVLVAVSPVKRKNIESFKEYLAKVEPVNKANVSSRLNARVEDVLVDEGSKVKKGDLLVVLDKKDIVAKLNAAKKDLAAAQENASYWQKEYQRDQHLFKAGAISEEERDRARNSFFQARARLGDSQQNIKFWQANLAYAQIRSPYKGVVSKRFVDPGDLAVVGKPLVTVEDRRQFKLSFDIPQEDLPFLKLGEQVFYKNGDKLISVKITNIFPSVAEGKVLTVEARLNIKKGLRPGEFIPVKVLVAKKDGVLTIPQSAVCKTSSGGMFVFMVRNNRLKKVPLVLGLESREEVEAKNLSVGDMVVINPYLSWIKLAEGEPVKVMNKRKR